MTELPEILPEQPYGPEPKGKSGVVIAVLIVVIVAVVALVLWFIVLPRMDTVSPTATNSSVATDTSTNTAASPSLTPTDTATTAEPATGVPDIVTQPSGWSQAVPLEAASDPVYRDVIDPGVDNLIIVDSLLALQAIDLNTLGVLWTIEGYTYGVTLDDGSGVVIEDEDHTVARVDLKTGRLTPMGSVPVGDGIIAVTDQYLITESSTTNQYCARQLTSLLNCQWKAPASISGPVVFGGHWLNTAAGVYDISTGALAMFGGDAYDDSTGTKTVFYAGQADAVGRFSVSPDGGSWIFQPWDTDQDQALGAPVTIQGYIDPAFWDAPWLLSSGDNAQMANMLTAYSWQTGEQLWSTPLSLIDGSVPAFWVHQNYVQVWMEVQETPKHPDRPTTAIVDGRTGVIVWQGDGRDTVGAGQRMVYLATGSPFNWAATLEAYDGGADGLPVLWTMDAPEKKVEFYAVAGQILALSSTGKLYVLQP